jgi:assimilatory nitrate reductase catalytic subunit
MFRRWTSPAAVFELLKQLSAGQPCDITGIEDYRILAEHGGIQWPFPARHPTPPATERRLFEDGRFYTPDGRARILFESPKAHPEAPNERYPFILLTGRGSASQWHTQTRTRNSAVLRKLYPERPFLEVNPADARSLGIEPDTWVIVESQRGRLRAKAFLTPAVQPGHVFIPMHYAATNQLTLAVFDPYSRQPSYKCCAVRLSRSAGV